MVLADYNFRGFTSNACKKYYLPYMVIMETSKKPTYMKFLAIIHPFLFLMGSIFFFYPQASNIAAPQQIIRPLLFLSLTVVVLFGPALWLMSDIRWAGVLLTIVVLGIFSHEEYAITALAAVAVILLYWGVRRWRLKVGQVVIILNLIGLFCVLFFGYNAIQFVPDLPESYRLNADQSNQYPVLVHTSGEELPDIYYIVLDGYGRSDILKDLYQYDNSGFIHALEEKGFVVPAESRSNYSKTVLSVASTMNMDYINTILPDLDNNYNWWLLKPLIDQSQVRLALEELGYMSVSVATDWSITDNSTTDLYLKPTPVVLNDFEGLLLKGTPLSLTEALLSNFAVIPSFDSHRRLFLYDFEALSTIPAIHGPTFTFVHVIAPHPPFVFDASGNPLDPPYVFRFSDASDFPLDDAQYRKGYIDQLRFLNQKLEETVNTLIANSDTPPIIILQADHGPGMLTDFGSQANTCLAERFSIFAAYYFPKVEHDAIPNDIAPVNVFRIIFNEYFDANLPLLDRIHYNIDDAYIFRGDDVTELVSTCTIP